MTTATNQTTSAEQKDANIALVSRAMELLLVDADPDEIAELYAPGFRYHEPRHELSGVPGALRICDDYLAGFSDVEVQMDSIEAVGDRVKAQMTLRRPGRPPHLRRLPRGLLRCRGANGLYRGGGRPGERGRHTGSFEGHQPSGREMVASGFFVHRISDGRIAETWATLRWS